jgi:hypothetical protein
MVKELRADIKNPEKAKWSEGKVFRIVLYEPLRFHIGDKLAILLIQINSIVCSYMFVKGNDPFYAYFGVGYFF